MMALVLPLGSARNTKTIINSYKQKWLANETQLPSTAEAYFGGLFLQYLGPDWHFIYHSSKLAIMSFTWNVRFK